MSEYNRQVSLLCELLCSISRTILSASNACLEASGAPLKWVHFVIEIIIHHTFAAGQRQRRLSIKVLNTSVQNGTMGCSGSKFVGPYDDTDWKDLPDEVKTAAKTLGYNKKSWDNDGKIALDDNEWEELSPEQQAAAKVLGMNEKVWNAN